MQVQSPAEFYMSDLGRVVAQGEAVEVDDALGAQLVAQGWLDVTDTLMAKSKGRKAAGSTPAETPAETVHDAAQAASEEDR